MRVPRHTPAPFSRGRKTSSLLVVPSTVTAISPTTSTMPPLLPLTTFEGSPGVTSTCNERYGSTVNQVSSPGIVNQQPYGGGCTRPK
ncbi:hypothetical protein K438DRAFT_1810923 [Mycena galopus ATCC 62051]|nr:hypothetical protein K438DRAFT_1810923 [Mycena galopus ATCC 62051]